MEDFDTINKKRKRIPMTAVVEVNEQYAQQFQQLIKRIPKNAIKLTLIKNNLDEEIEKRIAEIRSGEIETNSLSGLSWIRERYVRC